MSEQNKPQMTVVPVNEPIQRGDFAVLPGCDPKPVTELTGRWIGESLHWMRMYYSYSHPCHTMVILRPEPEPEPEWFDLTPHDGHVLRVGIDEGYCTLAGRNKWVEGVQWPEGTAVSDAKSWQWDQFRCLLKDAPPELLKPVESPKSRWRTPQLIEEPHPDAQYWNRSLQRWVRRGCPKDRYSKMETYRVPVCVTCGTRDVIVGTDTCVDCTNDAIPDPKPATQTIVFHEVIVRHGNLTEQYTLEWLSDIPKHSNWTPTGRTETREVVR